MFMNSRFWKVLCSSGAKCMVRPTLTYHYIALRWSANLRLAAKSINIRLLGARRSSVATPLRVPT